MAEPSNVLVPDEAVEEQAKEGERAKATADDVLSRLDDHMERMARALEIIAGGKQPQAWEDLMRDRRG